jgi:tetratricopeptide (TPR) repeat protein
MMSLAAIRLEELGFFAESIRQYERLVKLAPRCAEFPASLEELYDKAGRTADATKARESATQLGDSFAKKAAP